MKFSFRVSIVCSILLFVSCKKQSHSTITSVDSLSKVQQVFKHTDSKTLIVFDVDETLLMPADALWQEGRIWEFNVSQHLPISDELKNTCKLFDAQDLKAISNRMLSTQFIPVEDDTVSIVKSLQERRLKVIALTNFGPGQFGNIGSLKEFRRSQLCSKGIDFESSFPGLSLTLSDLPAIQSDYPEFYKGILFGANNPKGKVLCAFLDKIDFKPNKIIVIDDKQKYLDSVQQELAGRQISFQGFLYTGAEDHTKQIDPAVLACQLEQWQKILS